LVDALLAALPEDRRIAVRYHAYKRMFYGADNTSIEHLLEGSDVGRVGHVNDCFVSGEADVGTYQYDDMAVLKSYLAEDTAYVPIGGETCAVHARNSCETTLEEMTAFHYSYINDQYHPSVLATWDSEGCRPEIERRLGPRLALTTADFPEAVKPGGSFTVNIELSNSGFAAPTNARPVRLVLQGGEQRLVADFEADVRRWTPGSHALAARFRVPSNLAEGDYRLALWLPDAAPGLADRAEYAIRLSNENTWEQTAGDNSLGTLGVALTAEGDAAPNATSFERIP
jgi:hypothetical protein